MKSRQMFLKSISKNFKFLLAVAILFLANINTSKAQVVYNESFDGTTFVPAGWTNLLVSGSNTWTRETAGTSPSQAPNSGVGEAKFNSYSANGGVRALVTPPFTLLNNTSGAAVSFYMYRDAGYSTTPDLIDVFYNTSPNLTGATLLGTVNRSSALSPTVSIDGWHQYLFSIPNTVTSTNVYLILRATSAYGNNIYIDDVSWTAYPNICSGTPTVPSLSSATACPGGGAFNISATGASADVGISFQWQSSASSTGPFTNISGANSTSYGSSTTTTTFYQLVSTCSVSTLSSTTAVTSFSINNPGPCVCTTYSSSAATSTSDEEIIGVIFGSLTNTSSCSSTGPGLGSLTNMYSNYAGALPSPTVCPGAAIPFTVNVGSCGGFYTMSMAIYIDFDQNGSFADAGEQVFVNNGTIAAGNATGVITIPPTALAGLTRMRIILSETSLAQGPTGTYSWGETEDYCVTIVAPSITLSSNSGSICPGVQFTTTASGAVTYTINGGSGNISGSSVSLTPLVNTTYTISGTNGAGCIAAGKNAPTATVVTLASPSLTVAATPTAVCPGVSANIAVSGANTYTWTSPSSNSTQISVSPSVTTVYTVSGTGTTVCNGVKTVTLTVYPTPTVTVNSNTICAGTVFTMTPTGAATYTYANGSNTIAPTTNTTINVSGTSANGCVSAPVVAGITVVALPVVTVNSGTVCEGSQFIISPLGATNYTYVGFTNPITPSVSGTYSVIGSNTAGCVSLPAVSDVTVFGMPAITVAATPTDMVICNTDVLTLTASGASTYLWNNVTAGGTFSATPSTSSSYYVVGTDANGCTNFVVVNYTVNPLPAVSVNANTFVCLGNSSTITASGASSYSWTNASATNSIIVSPTVSTVYGVTGTSSLGCSKTSTISIQVNTIVMVVSSNTGVCIGNTVVISAVGATNYTWSPISSLFSSIPVSPSVTTTYSFNAIDSKQCPHSGAITVSVNPIPVIIALGSDSLICAGETATMNASGGSTYVWSIFGSNIGTGSAFEVHPIENTTYVVTGTDSNGCFSTDTVSLAVNKCTGLVANKNNLSGLTIYPNPTNGEFTIDLNNGRIKNIQVVDVTGRVVIATRSEEAKTMISLTGLANGIYYVKIQSNNTSEVIKVLKN